MKQIDEIKLFNVNDELLNPHNLKAEKCFRERTMSSFLNQQNKRGTPVCILDIQSDLKLQLQLNNVIRINCADSTLVAIVCGLYMGTKLLCAKRSSNACFVRNGTIQIDELIEFDINVINLARMTRLSVMLFEIVVQSTKKNTNLFSLVSTANGNQNVVNQNIVGCYFNNGNYTLSKRQHQIIGRETNVLTTTGIPLDILATSNNSLIVNALCWVNLNLFDYNSKLRQDTMTLPMWNFSELDSTVTVTQRSTTITLDDLLGDINSFDENQWHDLEDETLLNPLGTVVWNPNIENATCLTCTFINYTNDNNTSLFYPSMERLIAYYKTLHDADEDYEDNTFDDDDFNQISSSNQRKTKIDFNVQELEDLVQQMISTDDLIVNKNHLSVIAANSSISLNNLEASTDKFTVKNRQTKGGYQLLSNTITNSSNSLIRTTNSAMNLTIKGRKASKAYLDQLKEICKKDPLNDLDRQNKELIWYLKEFLKERLPNSLTHLIASVQWHKFKDQVLDLLVLINGRLIVFKMKICFLN